MSVFKRIIKTKLVDADDKPINPVYAFTRFGCWPLGPGGMLASIAFLAAATIGITMLVDYGLVDSMAHHKRQVADGDPISFFFRPQDILHFSVVLMLVLMVVAYFFKRVDSETDTQNPRTYLVIWHLQIVLPPLVASSLIMYYHVLRWNASADDAFEATVLETFIITKFILFFCAYPVAWYDFILPVVLAFFFVMYTIIMGKMFNVDLYTQLDWINSPQTAAANAALYILVVLIYSGFTTAFAIWRNGLYVRTTSYLPVGEARPLKF